MERTRDGGKLHTEEHTLPMPNSAASCASGEGEDQELRQDELPARCATAQQCTGIAIRARGPAPAPARGERNRRDNQASHRPRSDPPLSLLQRGAVPFNPRKLSKRLPCDRDHPVAPDEIYGRLTADHPSPSVFLRTNFQRFAPSRTSPRAVARLPLPPQVRHRARMSAPEARPEMPPDRRR